jgi:hypothetical protein
MVKAEYLDGLKPHFSCKLINRTSNFFFIVRLVSIDRIQNRKLCRSGFCNYSFFYLLK